jgi:hypothetical protein
MLMSQLRMLRLLNSPCLSPKHLEDLAWRLRNALRCLDQRGLPCLCCRLQVLLKHTCSKRSDQQSLQPSQQSARTQVAAELCKLHAS